MQFAAMGMLRHTTRGHTVKMVIAANTGNVPTHDGLEGFTKLPDDLDADDRRARGGDLFILFGLAGICGQNPTESNGVMWAL